MLHTFSHISVDTIDHQILQALNTYSTQLGLLEWRPTYQAPVCQPGGNVTFSAHLPS